MPGHEKAPSSAARPAAPSLALAVLGIALFWCLSAVFLDSGEADAGVGPSGDGLFPVSILSITLMTLAVVGLEARGLRVLTGRPVLAALLGGAVGSLGTWLLAGSGVGWLPAWAGYLGSAFMGCGGAAVMLGWGSFVSVLPTRASSVVIAVAYFVSRAALLLRAALPARLALACDVAACALSALLWVACVRGLEWPAWAARRGWREKEAASSESALPEGASGGGLRCRLPWKALALFFCCSLAGAVIEAAARLAYPGLSSGMALVEAAVAAAVLLAAVAWVVALKGRDFAALWPAFILVLLASLMIAPVWPLGEEGALGLIVAEKRCLVVLLWVLLASTIFREELPAVPAFGLGHVLLQSLPNLLGQLLGGALAGAMPAPSQSLPALCVAMALVILVALVAALFDRSILTEGFARRAPGGLGAQGAAAGGGLSGAGGGRLSAEEAVRAIGERCGLSDREREVVLLMARGHTFPRISDELGVSMNTIRTHARNIYRKLDAHSKQDIVDMVEAGMRA